MPVLHEGLALDARLRARNLVCVQPPALAQALLSQNC
jgi:hypothetical protein